MFGIEGFRVFKGYRAEVIEDFRLKGGRLPGCRVGKCLGGTGHRASRGPSQTP